MLRSYPRSLSFLSLILILAARSALAQGTTTEKEGETDVKAMLSEGIEQLQSGDMEAGAATMEKVIKADPKNIQAMLMAAQAYMAWGVEMAQDDRKAANKPLRRGAELMRMVKKIKPDLNENEKIFLATSIYNEACCAAVDGDADAAIKFLEEAIETGFNDINTLENDSDFASIKNDERFKAIVTKLSEAEEGEMEDDSV